MKKMMKSLLMMALAVFVGTAFAANPVATWTDFNTLTSGNYTLTKDADCNVNADGSITLGGAGLSLPVGGDAITVVMDVSGVPTTDGITVASVKMNGSYVSLKSTGTQLVQSWNNGGDYGTFDWTPAKRQTIVLGTMQSNPSGTTTWIDGEQKAANNGLMTSNGDLQNVYIGSYSGTGTDGTVTGSAAGMIVHSLRIYSTKLSTEAVVADYKTGNVDWVVSFDNNNRTIGWVNNWGGEANDSYVSTPNGQGYLIMNGYHPYYDYKLTKPSSIALYADISSVSEFTGNGAALIAFGKPGNSVEENSGNLVLSKVADGKVSVSRNGTQLVYIENADLAVAGSYHLFVFGINEDGKVFLSVDNEKKESEGSTTLPASGLQIGSMFTSIGSYVRAYNMVVDEVRGYEKYLSDAELASLREAFPAYSPNLVIVDANKNYSDLQIAESSNTTIIVNEGCTLTMNGEVTCNSLVIQGHGVVALDSEVGNPFGNVGRLTFDGITLQGGASAEKKITIANLISITSGKTLKTKGFLDFTNQDNTIASGATLEVVSGVTTFNLDRVGLSGTLKVAAGATFKNGTNDGPHYNATPTLDIAGTLEIINNARWSLPSRSTTTLREGAVLKGTATGDYNYSYDFFDGATITVLGNAEIKGCIGSHNGGTITFDIAKGKALTVSGVYDGGKNRGSPSLAVASSEEGEGVGTLVLAGANTYTGTTTINSGTTLVAASATALGTGNVTNSGTLELKAADTEATLAQVISGGGAVNVKAGTWKLTALNTIDGNVTIESGATLNIADQNARLFKGSHCTKTLTIKGTLITRNWIWGEENALGCLAHNNGHTVINGGKVVFEESFESPRIVQIGENGATFEIKNGETFAATAGDGNNAITGTGNLNIVSGTMKLQKSFASSGSMTIDKGAIVVVETGTLSAFVENLEESAGVNVNGTIEFLSSGMLYRSFAGNGVVAVKGDVAINNTGNNGKLTGLSRFKGSVIVDEGKTLTLTFWNNGYDIELSELEVNGSVTGNKGNGYATTLNLTTTKLSGSGTISGVDTFTLADGATLAGAVTVTSDVTVEGAVNVTHATQAGDTVITCANAEDVAAQLTGAPEGLKYVAKDGAVKLAAATVTVTLPAAPENMVWFYDGQPVENNAVTVNSGTSVTVTLKPAIDYIFSDNTTEKTFDLGEVIGDITGEIDIEDIVAVKPEVKIGEKSYATFASALAAAADGDTIVLEKDVICTEKPVFNNGGVVNVDVRDYVFVSTEQARVRNVASADGAVPSNNIKFVSGFGWEVYRPNTTEGVNFRVFPTLDAVIAYEPAQPNSARIYPYENVKQDKDVVLRKYGNGTSSTICIDPEYDITWDLNGYTVLQESPTGNPLEACVRGKFTLKDSSDAQTGKWIAGACGVTDPDDKDWYGRGGPAFYLLGEGELILKGGTVSIARNATPDMEGNEIINTGGLIYLEDGKLTVDGATLQVDDAYGIVIWGGEAVIQSGTFDLDPSESWALFASASAKVTINSPVTGAILVVSGADVTVNVPGVAYYEGPGYVAPAVGEGLMTFDGLVLEKGVAVVKSATSVNTYATFADALAAAADGDTIVLIADVTASDIIVLDKAITLDGNGKTLTSTAGRAINVATEGNVTIKNLAVNCSGERGINVITKPANLTIENCNITAYNYAVNVASSAGAAQVAITGSTLTGRNVVNIAGAGADVTIGTSTINCALNTTAEKYAALCLNKDATGATILVDAATVINVGSTSEIARNGAEDGSIKIDGVESGSVVVAVIEYGDYYNSYATIADAIAAATDGQTIKLIRDVNASEIITINKAITLDGNGKTLTSTAGRAINVSGANGVTIKNLTIDASGERAINIIQNATNVTIDNVTATAANYTVNVAASAPEAVVAIKNSNLTGLNVVNVAAEGANATITGGKLTCNDQNADESYSALALNKDAKNGTITATGVSFDIKGDSVKATNQAEGGTITIDGSTDDVDVDVACIFYEGNYWYGFTSLDAAIKKAKAGDTITLIRDVTITEKLAIEKNLTIDGNGKTLTYTGTDRAIDVPNTANGANLTIKDLTVAFTGGYSQRGINYNTNGKLTLDGVTVNGGDDVTYAVNLPSSSAGATVEINDSSITGLIALNVWGANATVDVTDTDLTSVDNATHENYAAVKLNSNGTDAAEGAVITITGGSITAKDENGNLSSATTNATASGVIDISETTVVTGNLVETVAIVLYDGANEFYGCNSLKDAIEKATGDSKATVKLLKDVEESVTIAGTVVLDLNGKTITSGASTIVVDGGELTVQDGTNAGKIVTTDATGAGEAIAVKNGGTLTLNGGNVESGAYGIYVYSSGGSVTMNGGSITVGGTNVDGMAIAVGSAAGSAVVTGGTIAVNGVNFPMYAWDGSISISGGTFDFVPGADYVAYGYGVEETTVDNETWYKVVAIDPVAYIGTTGYYSIKAAVEAAQAGDTVVVNTCTHSGDLLINKDITLEAAEGATVIINGQLQIKADGVTVKGLEVDCGGTAVQINAKDVLIEGCEITGSQGLYESYTSGTVTFKDSKITAATYAINFGGSAGGEIVIDNCEVTGWVNFAASIGSVTMTGSEFDKGNYAGMRLYNENVVIDGCTFSEGYAIDLTEDVETVTVTDTTVANGMVEDMFSDEDISNATITVDGIPLAFVAQIGSTKYFTLAAAVAAANADDIVKVIAEAKVDAAIRVDKKVTIDLNGQTVTSTEKDTVGDGVFCVVENGDLTINDSVGTGVVNGVGGNDYNIAIWANGGKVTINGGNFTNVGATDNTDPNAHFDLIYVKNSGEVVINGGTFECETPAFTLNSHDTYKGVITVNGGTFVGFDPRNNAAETAGTTFMAAGKYTFAEGGNYIVVTPEDYILNGVSSDSATVNEIDSLLAGAVTVTKDGEKYVATATYTFKVTAVDTVNPEKSSYELTGGKLRPGKTVAVKYIDLATGTEAWEKPESDTVTFKLVIK